MNYETEINRLKSRVSALESKKEKEPGKKSTQDLDLDILDSPADQEEYIRRVQNFMNDNECENFNDGEKSYRAFYGLQ